MRMALRIWDVFVTLFSGSERDGKASGGAEDEGQFVPSSLDLSVRVAHGGTDGERVRALSKIDNPTKDLEEHRREN